MAILQYASEAIKNLFRPPVTTEYPFRPFEYPEGTRGHVEITIDDCIGCGMCVRACPSSALSVDRLGGTWTINRFDCIACGYCVLKCPKKCLRMETGYQTPGPEKQAVLYTKSPEQLEKEKKQREEAAAKAAEAKRLMEEKKAAEAAAGEAKEKE